MPAFQLSIIEHALLIAKVPTKFRVWGREREKRDLDLEKKGPVC